MRNQNERGAPDVDHLGGVLHDGARPRPDLLVEPGDRHRPFGQAYPNVALNESTTAAHAEEVITARAAMAHLALVLVLLLLLVRRARAALAKLTAR
ncbi:hypothetical protein ABZZ20_16150 [Streptomyces sp. NPDC006430]|uniref:hypothetical protein n=1 Tax=Streptomyces sp. NPDC006430 TaxID=3154299 RepID=UPI0033ADDD66